MYKNSRVKSDNDVISVSLVTHKKVSVYEKIHGYSAVTFSPAPGGDGIHGSDAAGSREIYGDDP